MIAKHVQVDPGLEELEARMSEFHLVITTDEPEDVLTVAEPLPELPECVNTRPLLPYLRTHVICMCFNLHIVSCRWLCSNH